MFSVGLMFCLTLTAISVRILDRSSLSYTDNFEDASNSYWLSILVVTTIGYGDVVPESTLSQAVIVVGCFLGVGFFSILTLTIREETTLEQ